MKISLIGEIIQAIKYWRYVKEKTKLSTREKEIIQIIRLTQYVRELSAERTELIEKNERMKDFIFEKCGPVHLDDIWR